MLGILKKFGIFLFDEGNRFGVYKELTPKQLLKCLSGSMKSTGNVMLIVAGAAAFSWVLTRERMAMTLANAMLSISDNRFWFIGCVLVILLIAGCFLDSTSALYIFTPLFVPVAQALGIDMIHLGVVMIVNLAIGLFTPPVGVNLYVACGVAKVDLKQISKAVVPLLIAALIVLLIITYIPHISLLFA